MDIAAASMAMSAMQVQVQASVAVLDKTMDTQTAVATELIDQLAGLSVGVSPNKIDFSI